MTTDGTTVRIDDWSTLQAELRSWCGDRGEFRVETVEGVERTVCDFGGGTRFAVDREGRVETGMPLHEFEGRADSLVVTAGAVRVVSDDVEYVYRRP